MTAALLAAAVAVLAWPARRRGPRRLAPARRRTAPSRPAGVRDVPPPSLVVAAAAVVGAFLGTPLVGVLAGAVAYLAVRGVRAGRRAARTEERVLALTEGLAALAAELRSGRSLTEAADAAVAACGSPTAGRALGHALRSPGAPPESGDPVLSDALSRIAAGVLLSTRTGCSLAAVAAAVEDDLRARRRHREELRTALAAPRASALLLAGLPVLGLLMGSGIGADPWRVLTTTATGQVLLVAGVGLEVAGIAWSGRLVRRAVR